MSTTSTSCLSGGAMRMRRGQASRAKCIASVPCLPSRYACRRLPWTQRFEAALRPRADSKERSCSLRQEEVVKLYLATTNVEFSVTRNPEPKSDQNGKQKFSKDGAPMWQ